MTDGPRVVYTTGCRGTPEGAISLGERIKKDKKKKTIGHMEEVGTSSPDWYTIQKLLVYHRKPPSM